MIATRPVAGGCVDDGEERQDLQERLYEIPCRCAGDQRDQRSEDEDQEFRRPDHARPGEHPLAPRPVGDDPRSEEDRDRDDGRRDRSGDGDRSEQRDHEDDEQRRDGPGEHVLPGRVAVNELRQAPVHEPALDGYEVTLHEPERRGSGDGGDVGRCGLEQANEVDRADFDDHAPLSSIDENPIVQGQVLLDVDRQRAT